MTDKSMETKTCEVLTWLKLCKVKTERINGILKEAEQRLGDLKQDQQDMEELITEWLGAKNADDYI